MLKRLSLTDANPEDECLGDGTVFTPVTKIRLRTSVGTLSRFSPLVGQRFRYRGDGCPREVKSVSTSSLFDLLDVG